MKILARFAPYILLLAYIGFNEYRLADYKEVRFDAIVAVHHPEVAKQHAGR